MAQHSTGNPRPTITADGVADLRKVLAGPLPTLPSGDIRSVAFEIRRMRSATAIEVWRHPGWGELAGWILKRVPECDPTTAAVHAIQNHEQAVADSEYSRSLARYVCQIAQRSPVDPWSDTMALDELTWDIPDLSTTLGQSADSLDREARFLLSKAGATYSYSTWGVISDGIDVAVDWWGGLAQRSGLVGEELVVVARNQKRMTEQWRLTASISGPAARPLVALLLGGDQRGRWARRDAGGETGLLYWCLRARHFDYRRQEIETPPAAVCRAWSTHVTAITNTIDPACPALTPTAGPIIAA